MFKEKNEYKSILKCVVKLQCLGRRVVALSILKRQRDPYCDLTFAELDVLHKEEISRMEVAVNSKDFQLAADIEKKL
jgi:hypothetical protein